VELTPVSDGAEGLARIDANWLGPIRAALADGALAEFELIANDLSFTTRPRAAWRFWRRERHWMDLLRHSRDRAQA
jgi:hypothetical protein